MEGLLKTAENALQAIGADTEHLSDNVIAVVSPMPLQRCLDIPDYIELGCGRDLSSGVVPLSLESDFMSRLISAFGERGKVLRLNIPGFNIPSSWKNLNRTVEHLLNLSNATYRIGELQPITGSYIALTARGIAVSEDKHEELLLMGINTQTLYCSRELGKLILQKAQSYLASEKKDAPDFPILPKAKQILLTALERQFRNSLTPFLAAMQRRMNRDLKRVSEYYNDMSKQKLTKLDQNDKTIQQKLQAIEKELESKLADLKRKYSVKAEIIPLNTIFLETDSANLNLKIHRRKAVRHYTLHWNPLNRHWEPPACESCGISTDEAKNTEFYIKDDSLELLCQNCFKG